MKTTAILILCLALPGFSLHAQEETQLSRLSLIVSPTLDVPVAESAPYFAGGATIDLGIGFSPAGSRATVFGGIGYAFSPTDTVDSVSILTGRVGAAYLIPFSSRTALRARVEGGYYYGTMNDFSIGSSNPYVGGGAALDITLSPAFTLGVGALFRSYFGLYQGVSVGVETRFSLNEGIERRRSNREARSVVPVPQTLGATLIDGGMRVTDVAIDPVFPVFYSYYDDNPFGSVEITNTGDTAASDISVSFFIQQYMDNPKRIELDQELAPGASTRVELTALFTEEVLLITEGTRASAEVTVDYAVGDQPSQELSTQTVRFLNRNAMSWSDDRRAAAFITARDPSVLSLSKSAAGVVRSREVRSINPALQMAMALHEVIDTFGVNYVPDPTTPYIEFSTRSDAVDFLQFPRQTLQYRAGDCDDLSILYSALLESVGVDTAFVTTPGHIFVAVDTGYAPGDLSSELLPRDRVIIADDRAWIPVEVTLRGQGFIRAWEEGARQWYEAEPLGQAGFYPVEEAWSIFEPVGLPGAGEEVAALDDEVILAAYDSEMTRLVDRAIFPLVEQLQSRINATGSLRAMNRLGVLYARYGQSENARTIFSEILEEDPEFAPAILNLGNIAFLEQDWLEAERYFDMAIDLRPDSPEALLGVARVNQELQNYGNAQRAYARLRELDPELAQRYAYLTGGAESGGGRAADAESERRQVEWAEEEGDE
jgi:tetratricopeptide (TPR) repeat protein